MPRQIRVEYADAIYHVMARGNHREKIVYGDEDRKIFEATLEEVTGKMGWVVYAYVLMGNHYHAVFKTPEPNLVRGMTWLQSTLTKRHNARHKQRGHLFSGRYKAVLVEENDYLSTLVHYVHLNPARAKLVRVEDGLESYRWSSLKDYLLPPGKRRKWLAVEAGLAHMDFADRAAGRREFLAVTEGLVRKAKQDRAIDQKAPVLNLAAALMRGWCFGSAEFKEKMGRMLGTEIEEKGYRSENGYDGRLLRTHGEQAALAWISAGLDRLGVEQAELAGMRKMDLRKAMLARLVRRHTSVGLQWIADTLCMGVRSSVTRAEKILLERMKNDKKLVKTWKGLLEMQQISS